MSDALNVLEELQIDKLCVEFESKWHAGYEPVIESYLDQVVARARSKLFCELLCLDLEYRQANGQTVTLEDYSIRFPDFADLLKQAFGNHPADRLGAAVIDFVSQRLDSCSSSNDHRLLEFQHDRSEQELCPNPDDGSDVRHVSCPHCSDQVSIVGHPTPVVCPSCASTFRIDPDMAESLSEHQLPVIGKFRLLKPVGQGAFGTVYQAHDTELDRVVALKLPRSGQLATKDEEDRFLREGRNVAQLRHPRIVPVYEVGRSETVPFIVSEYVKGGTLEENPPGGRYDYRRIAELMTKLAEALDYAHSNRIVHRDLKPSNILIDGKGEPYIMDFGLAKRDAGEITMTYSGDILGTPAYMAPEQAIGDAHNADSRSDIYALGVIVFELLTGERPFRGNARMLLHQVVNEEPPHPRTLNGNIPRDLEIICLKCLEKEPHRRYQSASDLAGDLRRYLTGRPIEARPVSRVERIFRWARRNPIVATLAVMVASSLLLGTTISWYFAAQATKRAQQALEESSRANLRLSAANINLAQRDWLEGNVERVLERLQSHRQSGQSNPPGFAWHYLWRLCHRELFAIDVPDSEVRSVAFSPDGTLIACAVHSEKELDSLKIWEVSTGRKVHDIAGHQGELRSIAFSPDGKRITSAGSSDSEVAELRIWDVATGDSTLSLKGHTAEILCVTFSPDSKNLATGSADHTARIWEASTGQEILSLRGHSHWVRDVAFSADGNRLATASSDQTVKLWDLEKNQLVRTLHGHTEAVFCVALNRNLVASVSYDRTLRVWNATTGQAIQIIQGCTSVVAFSPDGSQLASASDSKVKIWDPTTGEEIRTLGSHRRPVSTLAFSPDGRRVVSGAGVDPSVRVWDAWNDPTVFTITDSSRKKVRSVAFGPKVKRIATACDDATVKVWDVITGQEMLRLEGHTGSVRSVAFNPKGDQLLSGGGHEGRPGELILWNATTGRQRRTFPGHSDAIQAVAFSPDGRRFASGGGGEGTPGELMVWDAVTGEQFRTFRGHRRKVLSVAFGPTGKRLVSGGRDYSVKVWDVGTGREILSIDGHGKGHRERVASVAFSPDGQRIASASYDQTVRVWETTTGRELHQLKGHTGRVTGVSFSPDGRRLVSCGELVRLWDTDIGQELLRLEVKPGHMISCITFSGTGHYLAAGGGYGVVRIWDARPAQPDLQSEKEAIGLLRFLRNRLALDSGVEQAIRSDPTISERVRQQALALSERYRDDPWQLNEGAWRVVLSPNGTPEQYQQALVWAARAANVKPDAGTILNTLGLAQCRVGQYEKALKTLTKSEKLNSVGSGTSLPADLAFLAIAQYRTGLEEQARATLGRLLETMKLPRWLNDGEARSFLREAESVLNQSPVPVSNGKE